METQTASTQKNNCLETERLLLYPTTEADAGFLFALVNSPKWLEHIGDRNVKSIEDAAEYIRTRILPQYERLGYGNFTVTLKTDGTKIGSCGLYDRVGLEGVDIGFAFLPGYEGLGYGYEAASRVRDAAFGEFGLAELAAITTKANTPSQKLLGKLGFQFERLIELAGDDEELMLFKLRK